MKRRIWMVSWYGTCAGGLERIVMMLNQVLADQYDVQVVDIPYVSGYGFLKKAVQINNRICRMIIFSLFTKWISKKGDIIITHGQNAPFLKSDFLFDHGSICSLKREMGEFIYGGSTVFEYIAVKKTKCNVAVSQWTRKQIAHNYHIAKEDIIVLENCIDTDVFFPIAHCNRTRFTILFCGRLEPAKGLSLLLKLAKCVEEQTEFELRIAANDSSNTELFIGRRNIKVECAVSIDKMNDFYNSGDVLFVPSRCEGFGMGIVEALAVGIPVLTHNVGIVEELITEKCPGIYVMPHEIDANNILAEIPSIIGENRKMNKRLDMHLYIKEHYGVKKYQKKVLSLLESV